MSEATLSKKADIALQDLATNGGLLSPEQDAAFLRKIIESPTLLSRVRTVPMSGPTRKINKIGFGQRILRAVRQTPVSQRALAEGERSKPTTDQIELNTSEVIAEVRIPYEVLEDNIERAGLENTLITLIAERAATDLEELLIRGDKSSLDDFLAVQDGVLKLLTSNIVDLDGVPITPDAFNAVVKGMPNVYRRNKSQLRFFVPPDVEQDYRNDQAKRGTGLGDATLTGSNELQLFGSRMAAVGLMPEESGIYTDPKNLLFGIQRNIRMETDKDISAREVIIVVTARVAIEIEEELAAVKMINIGNNLPPIT